MGLGAAPAMGSQAGCSWVAFPGGFRVTAVGSARSAVQGYGDGPKLPSPTAAFTSHLPPRSPSWGRRLAFTTLPSTWFSQPQAEGAPWTKLYFLPPGSAGADGRCMSRHRDLKSRCLDVSPLNTHRLQYCQMPGDRSGVLPRDKGWWLPPPCPWRTANLRQAGRSVAARKTVHVA